MAQAKSGDTVSVQYEGKFEDGTVFDSSKDQGPLQFTLGQGMMIPGFEEAVKGMNLGDIKTVTITPEKGYGPHQKELVVEIAKEQLPPGLDPEPGQRLQFSKDNHNIEFSVVELTDATVIFDANHPLAGKTLTFEIELVEIKQG